MQEALFTSNGLVFILTCVGGLIMAALVLLGDKRHQVSSYLLACFFFCMGASALSKLFVWTKPLKPIAQAHPEWVVFGYVLSLLWAGPFLYFYVSSISRSGFKLRAFHYAQLFIPLMGALLVVFNGAKITDITRELDPFDLHLYFYVGILGISPWIYTVLTVLQLRHAKQTLRSYYSGMMDSGAHWLDLLVYGYLVLFSWGLVSHFYGGHLYAVEGEEIPTLIGNWNNALGLALLVCVYFYSISSAFSGLRQALIIGEQPEAEKTTHTSQDVLQHIIAEGIEKEKLYLEATLNVERFAAKLQLRAKDVSVAINQQLDCNFFEFINQYRVEEAKRLLQGSDLPLPEVMLRAGFNSTSSFYRVFKKGTGLSPAQFRAKEAVE